MSKNTNTLKPGLNYVQTTGPICVSYISVKTGQLKACFLLDTGNHYVRCPRNVNVVMDYHDTVKFHISKYDPHEHPDTTPVSVTVIRPKKTIKDELKEYAALMIARHLGVKPEELETEEDANDFEIDEHDEAPHSISQLRVMADENYPLPNTPAPVDEPPKPPVKPVKKGKADTTPAPGPESNPPPSPEDTLEE